MNWYTADLHFRHGRVIKYCDRPYENVSEMEEDFIKKWNKVVRGRDKVYIIGDFGYTGIDTAKAILGRLNGTKVLIRGNHDLDARKAHRAGFFDVYDFLLIDIGGIPVLLCHYCYYPSGFHWVKKWVQGHLKYNTIRLHNTGIWLLHGHSHNHGPQFHKNQINVGVDHWNFTPISEDVILSKIKGRND